jgi:hypothetical protein
LNFLPTFEKRHELNHQSCFTEKLPINMIEEND